MNSFSKISSSEEEVKIKELPKHFLTNNSHRPRSHSSLGSKTESLFFDSPIKNIDNNINIESGNGTLNIKNFTNVDDSIFRKGNV